MSVSVLAFLPGVGPQEMLIVGVIALLLFGKRLPEVARSLGKGLTEFKKGMSGIDTDIEQASRRPAAPPPRPLPPEDRVESTAPKFEPPRFEPSSSDQA